MLKHRYLIFATFLLLFETRVEKAQAQNYSYTFADSSIQYVELDTSKTEVPASIWSDTQYQLPIGFTFSFAGSNYENLTLRSNGVLMFDQENKYNFMFLNKDFNADVDESNTVTASLFYLVSTNESNQKILKIEFKNVGFTAPGNVRLHCSFQVWLKEYSNKIEFHMGGVENDITVTDAFHMGLINMNDPNANDLGYLLSGDPAAPSSAVVGMGGALVSLTALPVSGTVYTFIPPVNQ